MSTLFLVLIDDFHLGDLLFIQSLGRLLAGSKRPCVLVHGDGGLTQRVMEASGFFPEVRDGVIVNPTPEEAALVERAVREQNRRLVVKMTDALVHAVGLQGGDRRLLRRGEGGEVEAGEVGWLLSLVERGAVPVVSALVAGEGNVESIRPDDAVQALYTRIGATQGEAVVFTRTNRGGLGDPVLSRITLEELAGHEAALADPRAARRLAETGIPLLVTSPPAFFAPGGASGTRISAI